MKQEMLINVSQPEECRIAIVEDGVLEELYVERTDPEQLRRQHLQGRRHQPGAEHPGGVRRLRRRAQRVPPHQRRRAPVLPPRRLRPATPGRQRPATPAGQRGLGNGRGAGASSAARRPAPRQAAHSGHPSPRRRGARPGDQGRDRHQGPHALDLHQHPRPLPGLDAGAGAGGRLAENRGRRRPAAAARHHARTEPAQGPRVHRPHGRHRPDQERAFPRHGLPPAAVEGHRPPDQEVARARPTSTKKAT